MPYSSFTLDEVEEKFGLEFKASPFIPALDPILPPAIGSMKHY
jgi:hypothetical protein